MGLRQGSTVFYTLGVLSQSASEIFNGHGGRHFDSVDSLVAGLQEEVAAGQTLTILVKGSRSARMERIVNALLTAAKEEQQKWGECRMLVWLAEYLQLHVASGFNVFFILNHALDLGNFDRLNSLVMDWTTLN